MQTNIQIEMRVYFLIRYMIYERSQTKRMMDFESRSFTHENECAIRFFPIFYMKVQQFVYR